LDKRVHGDIDRSAGCGVQQQAGDAVGAGHEAPAPTARTSRMPLEILRL
jgi:hypothetical protein